MVGEHQRKHWEERISHPKENDESLRRRMQRTVKEALASEGTRHGQTWGRGILYGPQWLLAFKSDSKIRRVRDKACLGVRPSSAGSPLSWQGKGTLPMLRSTLFYYFRRSSESVLPHAHYLFTEQKTYFRSNASAAKQATNPLEEAGYTEDI